MGERNIIALCYFFADMFNGKEEKKQYANETMVVIDDPVSSFDIDNRIGIISFLNRQFRMLLTGNENTRIVLMSHDLQTIDDIGKAFNAINKPKNWKSSTLLLKNNKLEPKNNILNEYQSLIDIVYDYANGIPNGNELTIGNTTRRVAEAFTTFEYKGGIDELLAPEVLGTIHDDTLRDYFEGRLTNILLQPYGGQDKNTDEPGIHSTVFRTGQAEHRPGYHLPFVPAQQAAYVRLSGQKIRFRNYY